MTPKQKAQELLIKYTSITLKEVVPGIFLAFDEELCKKFALIAVDEILSFIEDDRNGFNWKTYYIEVKEEIEKL